MASDNAPADRRTTSGRILARSLLGMYVLAGVSLFIPLLTIPHLARVLGPEAWGRVLCAQAVGTLLVVIVEFGFNLTGTRCIAAAPGERLQHLRTLGDILSAKLGCSVFVLVIGLLVYVSMPIFHGHALIVAMTVLWGVMGGLNLGWYFQGTQRPALALTIDVIARVSGALAIVLLVDSPTEDWLVIALNAAVAVLALLTTAPLVMHEVGWPRLSLGGGWSSIRRAGPLASYVLLAGFRSSSNRIVLGYLASPAVVASFGNAERLTDLIVRASEPASRVFYPLMCETATAAPAEARRVFSRAALLVGVFTVGLAGITMLFASPIVRLMFGDAYPESVRVLRLLALFPVLKVATMMVNTFWAQPHGLDRHMTPGVLLASVVGIVLAVMLVDRWGAMGMAVAAITAEAVFLVWSVGFLALAGRLPMGGDRQAAGGQRDLRDALRPRPTPVLAIEELAPQCEQGG